jgi:hypothetical protein
MTTAISTRAEAQLQLPDVLVRDYIANLATAGSEITALQAGSVYHQVRGAVLVNVANLAAFTVAQNGVTFSAGDYVLLTKQTTAAQNGVYVVGTVSGTAPLTRPAWWATGSTIVQGTEFVASGTQTLLPGVRWKCFAAKAAVVGTDDPLLYPNVVKGCATLIAGTSTIGNSSGLFLKSATDTPIQLTRNTSGTTTLTVQYQAPAATRVAGVTGTAEFVIIAAVAAGTINVADVSTVDWLVTNF